MTVCTDPKSLYEQCIRSIAANLRHASSLGNLPQHVTEDLFNASISQGKISDATLGMFLEYAQDFRRLNLQNNMSLNDESLCQISRCTDLVSLNLQNCVRLSSATAISIFQRCINLREVVLNGCYQINNQCLQTLAKSTPANLSQLGLSGCYEVSLAGIQALNHCKKLTDVDFSFCPSVDDRCLSVLAERRLLTRVSFAQCPITDAGVIALVSRNCLLRDVNLSGCQNLTDRSGAALAKFCFMLESVNLAGCSRISDFTPQLLAQRCRSLQYLNLTGLPITDGTAYFLRIYCKNLRELVLKSCIKLTDEAIHHLGKGCLSLELLDLDGCFQISDKCTESLAALPKLKELNLSFCRRMPFTSFVRLAKGNPALQKLSLFGQPVSAAQTKALAAHVQVEVPMLARKIGS